MKFQQFLFPFLLLSTKELSGFSLLNNVRSFTTRNQIFNNVFNSAQLIFRLCNENEDGDTTNTSKKKKIIYAPSQYTIKENKKWRITAACAVLNSQNEMLVGERINIHGAWQAPQGGVDQAWYENNFVPETIEEAAARELYEEMGLVLNQHVMLYKSFTKIIPVRYETSGTNNWLIKSGFAGQELHWVIFRVTSPSSFYTTTTTTGSSSSSSSCVIDLSGKNGEAPEFKRVKWESIDKVAQNMWPKKRGAYKRLLEVKEEFKKEWFDRCSSLDFSGTWIKENDILIWSRVGNLVENDTKRMREDSYDIDTIVWNVKSLTRCNSRGEYKEESNDFIKHNGITSIFVAEPDSDMKIALITSKKRDLTKEDKATIEIEEWTRYYVKNNQLILKRTVIKKGDGIDDETVVKSSKERFYKKNKTE